MLRIHTTIICLLFGCFHKYLPFFNFLFLFNLVFLNKCLNFLSFVTNTSFNLSKFWLSFEQSLELFYLLKGYFKAFLILLCKFIFIKIRGGKNEIFYLYIKKKATICNNCPLSFFAKVIYCYSFRWLNNFS